MTDNKATKKAPGYILPATGCGCGLLVLMFIGILAGAGTKSVAENKPAEELPSTAVQARTTAPATSPASKQLPSSALKWYQGGTLHKATGYEWRKATRENKIATCGDFLSLFWIKKQLKPPLSTVQTVDGLQLPAAELANQIDTVMAEHPAQQVGETAVILMTMMGWL